MKTTQHGNKTFTRRHSDIVTSSWATYSGCEKYRYLLRREWDADLPYVNFVMLNPSTATELNNDPTVARCEERAHRMGYGGYAITNIFAYRATDPRAMKEQLDPVGDINNSFILDAAMKAGCVVCAWGVHGSHRGRDYEVEKLLRGVRETIMVLKLSKSGMPCHPLYLPFNLLPKEWKR